MDWNTANWNVTNMEEYETEYKDICKPSALGLVLIPGEWNVTIAKNLCKNFRGNMNVITDAKNNEDMINLMKKSELCSRSGKIEFIKGAPQNRGLFDREFKIVRIGGFWQFQCDLMRKMCRIA